MKVSMNGLRWQLLRSYNSLTYKLNSKINGDEITIDPDYIQKELDTMRSCLVTLAFMFDEREGGFKILEDPKFETFNPEEEELEDEY